MDNYNNFKFPENFKVFPPSDYCKGPELIPALFSRIQTVFPRCMEGAHLKLRRKFKPTIWAGYNHTLSSVHPGIGQLAVEFRDKFNEAKISITPTGHSALGAKIRINPTHCFAIDAQLDPKGTFVADTSIIYSRNKMTVALTVSASPLPSNIANINPDASKMWNVVDNFVTSGEVQILRKLFGSWIVGGLWRVGNGGQVAILKKMCQSDAGVAIDISKIEGYLWKRVTTEIDVGIRGTCPWHEREKALVEIGGKWKYSGNQLRFSFTTEGIVGCDYHKRVLQAAESHIDVKLSGLLNVHNYKFRLGLGMDFHV